MRKRFFVLAFSSLLLPLSVPAQAQQPKKVPRIGYLGAASPNTSSSYEAFRQGLRELGYVEGKNLIIEYRWAERELDRLPDLAAELVRLKVDVIVTGSTPAALAAKGASKTIPVVFSSVSDPVGSGLVASLSRPGGNITGLSNFTAELTGKRLELLKEALPKVSRVAVFWNAANPAFAHLMKETQVAAHALGVQLQSVEIRSINDFDSAFSAITKERAQAFLTMPDPLINSQVKRIVDFAAKNRLPAMHGESRFVEAGGLMSDGPNFPDLSRRAATYVDKILKGAKPADLPVVQPTKFEFIINLKAAKQIGLTFRPNMLALADKVIK